MALNEQQVARVQVMIDLQIATLEVTLGKFSQQGAEQLARR